MNLNIADRLILLQLLPEVGNRATIRVINEFAAKVGLSEEELSKYVTLYPDGRTTISAEGLKYEVDINIPDFILKHYKERFVEMEARSTLPRGFAITADKFLN